MYWKGLGVQPFQETWLCACYSRIRVSSFRRRIESFLFKPNKSPTKTSEIAMSTCWKRAWGQSGLCGIRLGTFRTGWGSCEWSLASSLCSFAFYLFREEKYFWGRSVLHNHISPFVLRRSRLWHAMVWKVLSKAQRDSLRFPLVRGTLLRTSHVRGSFSLWVSCIFWTRFGVV